MSKVKDILVRYRILVIVAGIGILAASWEIAPHGDREAHLSPFDFTLNDKAMEPHHVEELVAYMNAYAELYPEQANSKWLIGARYLFIDQDPQKAREHFQQALDSGLSDENLLFYYVFSLIQLDEEPEKIERAIDEWQQNYPHSNLRAAALYRGLAKSLLSRGRRAEAIPALQTALETEPEHVETRFLLAQLLERQGEVEAAVAHYRQLIVLDANHAGARGNLGVLLMQRGATAEAFEHFQRALQANPADVRSRYWLAMLLAASPHDELRDGAAAAALIQDLMNQADSVPPQLIDALAAAYAEQGDYPRAVATVSEALAVAQEMHDDHLTREFQSHLQLYQQGTPLRLP